MTDYVILRSRQHTLDSLQDTMKHDTSNRMLWAISVFTIWNVIHLGSFMSENHKLFCRVFFTISYSDNNISTGKHTSSFYGYSAQTLQLNKPSSNFNKCKSWWHNTVASNPRHFIPPRLVIAPSPRKFTRVARLCTHCGVWMHINHSLPYTHTPPNQAHYYPRRAAGSQNICHAAVGTSLLSSWRGSEALPPSLSTLIESPWRTRGQINSPNITELVCFLVKETPEWSRALMSNKIPDKWCAWGTKMSHQECEVGNSSPQLLLYLPSAARPPCWSDYFLWEAVI